MKLAEAIKSDKFNDERHKATINIIYSAYWLKNSISSELKEYGLTVEQHNVLRILMGSHPKNLCVKDIASRIVEKSSNVPRIVDRLVIKKLVKRAQSEEDKRETLVSLTDKGIETIGKVRKIVDEITSRVVNMSEEDAVVLNNILEKMRSPMEENGQEK